MRNSNLTLQDNQQQLAENKSIHVKNTNGVNRMQIPMLMYSDESRLS